jgi:hypothetical protein
MGGGGMGGGGGDMGGDMGGMGGGGGMGSGGGMGMGGGGAPSMPQIKAVVRWETAAPVLQATKSKWPDAVAGNYLITVTGLPMMGGGPGGRGPRPPQGQQFQAGGGQAPPPQQQQMNPEERRRMMQERLKDATRLERKGKDPIAPSEVRMGQAQDGSAVMMFLFMKGSQPIEPADKEVTFLTQMGPLGVKAKFPLKDMIVNGKLEL